MDSQQTTVPLFVGKIPMRCLYQIAFVVAYLYLPNGVLNVVKNDDFSSSLICQNPDLASRVEKTVAPAIRAPTL